MKNVVVIHPNIPDIHIFKESLKDSDIIIYSDLGNQSPMEEILVSINSDTQYLCFVWDYPGYPYVPFLQTTGAIFPHFQFFSENFIKLVQCALVKQPDLVAIDLLCCDLNRPEFVKEVSQIEDILDKKIQIRYSTNKVGNRTDWIQESNGTDIRDIYFNDKITKWNHVLSSSISVTQAFGSNVVQNGNTFTLRSNVTWNQGTNYITLNANQIFDGGYYTITVPTSNWLGIFAVDSGVSIFADAPTVRNLGVACTGGIGDGTIGNAGGAIFRPSQKYFILQNSSSSGTINDQAGGLCGAYSGATSGGMITISNCFSNGTIGQYAGGICGAKLGQTQGNATISNCYSTGAIGSFAGGIVGSGAGENGIMSLQRCYSSGNISQGAGGIAGSLAGTDNGNAEFIQCYATGNIVAIEAGGICGNLAAQTNGNIIIDRCFYTGEIGANNSGGLCGYQTGHPGSGSGGFVTVSNCYTTGNISSGAFGLFGSFEFASSAVLTMRLLLSDDNIEVFGGASDGLSYCNGNALMDSTPTTYTSKIPTSLTSFSTTIWGFSTTLNRPELEDFYASPWIKLSENDFRVKTVLFGLDLSNANLSGQDLSNANVTNATFNNTNIIGADISGITFTSRQKLQLLKNANNRQISSIQVTTVLGSDMDIDDQYASLLFNVLIPDPTNRFGESDFQGIDYFVIPSADAEIIIIKGISYNSLGSLVYRDTQPIVDIVLNNLNYLVLAGSIIGIFDYIICFLKGSQILTELGYQKVEDLSVGTRLLTHDRRSTKICEIYSRRISSCNRTDPYRIPKNSSGCFEDLYLSPNHMVVYGGRLEKVKNISEFKQVNMGETLEYYHIKTECPERDILIANGVACESYYEGSRKKVRCLKYKTL